MKIVINIPQKLYDIVSSENGTGSVWAGYIKNGTPLPENHGDLIDRDALIYNQTHHCGYQTPFKLIDENKLKSAPAIIERSNIL